LGGKGEKTAIKIRKETWGNVTRAAEKEGRVRMGKKGPKKIIISVERTGRGMRRRSPGEENMVRREESH